MTVLVTRPSPQGQELCAMLDLVGIPSIHHPLIKIVPGRQLNSLNTQLNKADIVIAVSQHAVDFANKHLSEHKMSWPLKTYLAIGQKTAHSLSKTTHLDVNYPLVSDSEHFVELAELTSVRKKYVVILRGNGGREYIKDTLIAREANVHYCETYQRLPIVGENPVPIWQKQRINTVVITSSEQLTLLYNSTLESDRHWLTQLYLIVPSARIAGDGEALGFCHITIARSAANKDIISALQSTQDSTYER